MANVINTLAPSSAIGNSGLVKPANNNAAFSTNYNLLKQYGVKPQTSNTGLIKLPSTATQSTLGFTPQSLNTGAFGTQTPTSISGLNGTSSPSTPNNASLGSYKGTAITPGTQQQIQAQMAAIDAKNAGAGTQNIGGGTLSGQTAGSSQQTGGASGSLAQQNTNPYVATTPSFPGLVGGLATTAMQPTPQYTAAQNQYLAANQALADLNKQYAQQGYNIGTSRTNLAEAGGEQGLLQNLYTGQEQALAQEMGAAQAAAQVATQQQLAQQSGLAAAGGLASPVPAQALGFYNPATGEFTQYGGGQGQGGAFGAGQVLGNVALGQQFQQQLAPAFNAASSILYGEGGNQSKPTTGSLQGFLNANQDINPTSINAANFADQWINNQFSNPKYTELAQYLNEFLNTLTPLIGAAGNTTNYKQQIVNAMIKSTASGQSMSQALGNLFNNIASAKFGSIYNTGQSTAVPGVNTGTQAGGGNVFGSFFG